MPQCVVADFGISVAEGLVPEAINPVFAGRSVSATGGLEMASMGAPPRGSMDMASMGAPSRGSTNLALTPHYCAPERLVAKNSSFADLLAADVYTFGPDYPSCLTDCGMFGVGTFRG